MRRNKFTALCSRHGHSQEHGFTLVELLLYISISTTVLLAGSLYMSTLLAARVKNQAIHEVEQQGLYAMNMISGSARNAELISSPSSGVSAGLLTLDVITAANDPTVYNLAGGKLTVKEGSAAAIPLTNDRVIMSGLSFQNLSAGGTPGTIRIRFTLSHTNPSNRQEYVYTKTFYGGTSLRQP